MQKNENYPIEITAISSEGNGVGKVDGMVVFVPFTAIGDKVRVRIVKAQKRHAYGIVTQMLSSSPLRIPVDCPVFQKCGGCVYRHIDYAAELDIKQQIVEDAFRRIGKIDQSGEPILGCRQIDGYRNKVQLPVSYDADGKLVAGYYARRSHRHLPVEHCMLQPPLFSEIIAFLVKKLNMLGVTAYSEATRSGTVRHLYLRQAEATGEVMVCIVAAEAGFRLPDSLIGELLEQFPQIKTVIINDNPEDTNVILGKRNIVQYGGGTITDQLCSKEFVLSPASFYQINRTQAERLYRLAAEYADCRPQDVLVDLYCGVGTIGISMADQVAQLIGVEIVPEAVKNARENARRNQLTNAEFHCGDASMITNLLQKRQITPNIVVLDPPRKGCDAATLAEIAAMQPRKIVMVSCNPATAARDCAQLTKAGYTVARYRAVDLFPRTQHVECVVLLSK